MFEGKNSFHDSRNTARYRFFSMSKLPPRNHQSDSNLKRTWFTMPHIALDLPKRQWGKRLNNKRSITDPICKGRSASRFFAKNLPIASTSSGSPTGVPVPWHSK